MNINIPYSALVFCSFCGSDGHWNHLGSIEGRNRCMYHLHRISVVKHPVHDFRMQGIDRFLNLFETIKKELRSLTSELQRITEYEYLYGDSAILQDLLCKSYINMLRFWSRVDKECDRCCECPTLSFYERLRSK